MKTPLYAFISATGLTLAREPQAPFGVSGGSDGFRCVLELEPALDRATVL